MKTRNFTLLVFLILLNVQVYSQVVNKYGQQVLGNVDNTTDANKPVSTAAQTALNLKANLASPTFSGTLGIGTTTPAASSLLDITSTTKGILFPRMTTVQRNAIISPASGLHVFDTDVNALWFFDGAVWINYATQAKFGDIKSGIQTADHDGWFILNGRLKTDLNVRQQGRATALSIGDNVPNASNSYLSQNGGTMGAVSTNNNTVTLAQANLPNITIGGSANAAGEHQHWVDPPNTTTTTNGQHDHSIPRALTDLSFVWSTVVWSPGVGFLTSGSTNTGQAGNHNHNVDIGSFNSGSAGNHTHTITTNSINGAVTQTAVNITPKTLTVNMFIYLGL